MGWEADLVSGTAGQGLLGQKLVIAGNEGPWRRRLWQETARLGKSREWGFTVAEGLEQAAPGDFVVLLAAPEDMERLDLLLGQLRKLTDIKPGAAVLVSDDRVYGKKFGPAHPLKEHELGYVCHTDPADGAAFYMRLAEHFASRLAAEDGVKIRIVRLAGAAGGGPEAGAKTEKGSSGADTHAVDSGQEKTDTYQKSDTDEEGYGLEAAAEGILRVLTLGTSGEVYNLPGDLSGDSSTDGDGLAGTSPLSPNPVRLNTEKYQCLKEKNY